MSEVILYGFSQNDISMKCPLSSFVHCLWTSLVCIATIWMSKCYIQLFQFISQNGSPCQCNVKKLNWVVICNSRLSFSVCALLAKNKLDLSWCCWRQFRQALQFAFHVLYTASIPKQEIERGFRFQICLSPKRDWLQGVAFRGKILRLMNCGKTQPANVIEAIYYNNVYCE